MFEDISAPIKGKGKEKDVGRRRAYVRVVTSLGGGSLNLELYCEKVCVSHSLTHPFLTREICLGTQNMLQFPHACSRGQI